MAVQNRLARNQVATTEQGVNYEVNGLKVNLTPQIVRNYLVSGNKEAVTMQELAMFINLCKFSKLNPWLKEAYCIKYGNEPATMVVGKEAFQKRADNDPNFDGQKAGIIVIDYQGELQYRMGSIKLPDDQIIGGWAEVWRKDKVHSYRVEVGFDEYAGRKKDGSLNGQWSKKPATMIRKVALVQALREAFPNSFAGMYSAEEQGIDDSMMNEVPIEPPKEAIVEQPVETVNAIETVAEPTQPTQAQDAASALFS